jgi:hypothetical protein
MTNQCQKHSGQCVASMQGRNSAVGMHPCHPVDDTVSYAWSDLERGLHLLPLIVTEPSDIERVCFECGPAWNLTHCGSSKSTVLASQILAFFLSKSNGNMARVEVELVSSARARSASTGTRTPPLRVFRFPRFGSQFVME